MTPRRAHDGTFAPAFNRDALPLFKSAETARYARMLGALGNAAKQRKESERRRRHDADMRAALERQG